MADDERIASIKSAAREGRLDFSRFHPLDHHPWECWSRNRAGAIYGRTLVHIRYELEHRTDLGWLGDVILWCFDRWPFKEQAS